MLQSTPEMSKISQGIKRPRLNMTLGDGLWQILARTNHLVVKVRQKELREYGITMNDSVVLVSTLRLKELATPTNISRQLFWEPHTVSAQLKIMEKKGLIRRVHDLGRHNLIRVEVTDKGLEAFRQSSHYKSTRKAMSALSKEEQVQLWMLVAKIRQNTMKMLGLSDRNLFPPADPNEL
jgi:DNA-binding MarR family transcriptional regulator